MTNCLFCDIVSGAIPSTLVYKDEDILAFKDIDPKAPTHILIIPRKHISTINELSEDDDATIGSMIRRAGLIAADLGHADNGFRTVINCNEDAGQTVFHIHLHLLAGRALTWPPG